MQLMTVREVTFTKQEIDSLSKTEQILLILIGHLHNEVTILHKLLIFSHNKMSDNKIERRVQTSQALLISRVIIGKLFEGWQMLQKEYFGNKLSLEYEDRLSDQGRKALQELKTYFSKKNNIIKKIRDNYSFHYSTDDVKRVLNDLKPEQEFQIIIAREIVNSHYFISEDVVSRAMLNIVGSDSLQNAMEKYYKEITKVSSLFIDFTGYCLIVIFDKHFKDTVGRWKIETIQIQNPLPIREISIPVFVSK